MTKYRQSYSKQKTGYSLHKIKRDIVVTDNWYPCYKDNKIRLTMYMTNMHNQKYVKICAYGADDFGVEKIYYGYTYNELLNKYKQLKSEIFDKCEDGINVDWFYERGFFNA